MLELGLLAAVVGAVAATRKDILRYLKIRSM
jgi:hypothetical protein